MLPKIVNFIPPQYKATAIVVGLLLLASSCIGIGWTVNGWRLNEKMKSMQLEAQEQYSKNITLARELERKYQAFSDLVASEVLAEMNAAEKETQIVEREVIKYVEITPDSYRCNLPAQWVYPHDRAAGVPGDSESFTNADGTTRTVPDARALSVVTENYASCTEDRVKLRGLQKWVRGLVE